MLIIRFSFSFQIISVVLFLDYSSFIFFLSCIIISYTWNEPIVIIITITVEIIVIIVAILVIHNDYYVCNMCNDINEPNNNYWFCNIMNDDDKILLIIII